MHQTEPNDYEEGYALGVSDYIRYIEPRFKLPFVGKIAVLTTMPKTSKNELSDFAKGYIEARIHCDSPNSNVVRNDKYKNRVL